MADDRLRKLVQETADLADDVDKLPADIAKLRQDIAAGDDELDLSLSELRAKTQSLQRKLRVEDTPNPCSFAASNVPAMPGHVVSAANGVNPENRPFVNHDSTHEELRQLAVRYGVNPGLNFSHWTRLDGVACVVAGVAGGLASLGSEPGSRLHDHATQMDGHGGNVVESLLGHAGDRNDEIVRSLGDAGAPRGMHRLFSGHDFLQLDSGKNIVALLVAQHGLPMGLAKSVVHPLYDLFSAQGMPLPGSSNFAHAIYTDWCDRSVKVYDEFFTVHASDIVGTGLTGLLLWAYRKADARYWSKRPAERDYRFYEMNMTAYALCAATTAVAAGSLNWPAVTWLLKNFVGWLGLQGRVTKELRKRVLALNEQVANGGQGPSPSDRVREMDRQFDMLIQEEN